MVIASIAGQPPLSKVVPVKIYTKEYIDYITTFIYPQSPAGVRFDRVSNQFNPSGIFAVQVNNDS